MVSNAEMALDPWAEHKARPIHDSKRKLEAQHWKTAKLLELPPSLMEAANTGTRWGGGEEQDPSNPMLCPPPVLLS